MLNSNAVKYLHQTNGQTVTVLLSKHFLQLGHPKSCQKTTEVAEQFNAKHCTNSI